MKNNAICRINRARGAWLNRCSPIRRLFALVAVLCVAGSCAAAGFDPFQGPKPLAVFIQSNPWAMVIGADTPRVAIYENGDVIFVKDTNGSLAYHYIALDEHQLEIVRARLKPVLALKALKLWYDLRPGMSDQPVAMFYLQDGDREVSTSVRGLTADYTKLPGYTKSTTGSRPAAPPAELIELHKWLCELDYANSKEWTPKYVQVMFWDYSYAPEASIHWPDAWPSLNSDRAKKGGDTFSIFLDGSMLPKVREFLATQNEKGAVEIGGKKMAASYRYTFPGERAWHKAFAQTAEERQDRE